jgi:amino acid adenylation domain-containing protein
MTTNPGNCDFAPFELPEVNQPIHRRFETMAARFGGRLAVRDPERSVTYAELNTAANNIARAITQRIGGAAGQIAFVIENDARAIQTIFGILKTGRAYVPLDPNFPQDRLTYMAAFAESKAVVTDMAHRDLARQIAGPDLPLLVLEEINLRAPAPNPEGETDPLAMAYILFTSGSTGKPKGIAFAHRNLLHTTMCLINNLRLTPLDRLTQLHSTSFAASVVDIYCSLLAGASVFPWDVKKHGTTGVARWLTDEAVTSVQWIPTPLRQMLETLEPGKYFQATRLLVMASEPLTRREYDLYQKHFPDTCRIVNQMGTSESYNYALFFADKRTVFEGTVLPSGFSVHADREILLLDEQHQPVKPGEIGEIAIRSRYMSLGYWRNPEQTNKVFLPDAADPQMKTYLTGDLGAKLADGCLIHKGRKDFQIKIRGYRIELPEVELAVKKLPGVRDTAVMARPDSKGELKLVAYYLTDAPEDLSVTEMRRELAARLPDYMVPNLFIRLKEFPMTPSGKLDKNALPAPGAERPRLAAAFVEPRTETEQTLTAVWQEVLGREKIGVADNFFELGGDSLQVALILHRVNTRCGVELDFEALMRTPTIEGLAALIGSARQQSREQLVGAAGETVEWRGENFLRGLRNRVLQVLALYAPGLTTWRVRLHRWRGVHIGNNCAIGTAAIIETARPELVWLGDNVSIGIRNVIIGHFSNSIGSERDSHTVTVRIGNDVYIGPCVTILPNVTIGDGAVVTAGSVVSKSVPPRTMVRGNPAVPIAVCEVPLARPGVTYAEFLKHLRPIGNAGAGTDV